MRVGPGFVGLGQMRYVHEVSIVRAIPYYGFHADPVPFLKVTLYNPDHVKRTAIILAVCIPSSRHSLAVP